MNATPNPFLPTAAARVPRLAIFMSGSGSNAERILERVRRGGRVPFEPVALVTDAPETSRALEIGRTYDIPVIANDIRGFYAARGETRVSIATPRGRELREAWTDSLRRSLADARIDFAVFAGFVPLTNITADFPCLNVHPGDLTYLKDNRRHLVGLHTVPIERAILDGLSDLRSSVILAVPYSGEGDDMDSGPILGISAPVAIDLAGATVAELAAVAAARPQTRPRQGYDDRLEAIAKANQETLKVRGDWVVLPPVLWDFAEGRFARDQAGDLLYRLGAKWHPVQTVVYDADDGREVLFRDPGAKAPR